MKEKIKKNKIIILVIILILAGIGIGTWINHQQAVKSCKKQCYYVASREPSQRGGLIFGTDKGDYWSYKFNKFETQEQCIDYCLTVE